MKLSSRSITPLVEIVIVLFFFSLLCTVVVEMFVSSEQKSRLSADVAQAVIVAGDCAERLKGDSAAAAAGDRLPNGYERREEEGRAILSCGLDEGWNQTLSGEPRFLIEQVLSTEPADAGTLVSGRIDVYRCTYQDGTENRELLTRLDFADYQPSQGRA